MTPTKPKAPAIEPMMCKPLATIAPTLPCVRARELIGKEREVLIEHDGMYYRLRITRANKLILTK